MTVCTDKANILRHNGLTPRYTSYPPAPLFQPGFGPERLAGWLTTLKAAQTLSLYLHIPFCARLCYYCGCHTTIANHYERITDYLGLLNREIDRASAVTPPEVKVSHLHFGGGSPTMLADEDFIALTSHLRRAFSLTPDAEIALEADPRQITQGKIDTYARSGVTRLSLGVQDFDQDVLRLVNREQPYELTEQATRQARAAGIKGINMDIMYGLPRQTLETQRKTLEKVIGLSPDRIAFFGYAHVPWMKKHMAVIGENSLPGPELRYDLFESGRDMLIGAGYHAIGIDHFVRDHDSMYQAWRNGTLRRNFQGYTTDSADALLGLGASSISSFPQGYSQNYTDLRAWADAVESGRLPTSRGHIKTADDRARGDIIMRIMCDFKVGLDDVAQMHDLPASSFDNNMALLAPLVADGLVFVQGRSIHIAAGAAAIARIAARAFDAYATADQSKPRHSSTV